MTDPKSPADFPTLRGIRMFIGDGNDVAFEFATDARPAQFRAQTGQLGMIIAKILESGREAQKRRGESGLGNILNDIAPMAALANATVKVANTIGSSGQGMIGIVTEIGGVPFTGMLSPDQALELAEQLQSAARDQAKHTQRKSS